MGTKVWRSSGTDQRATHERNRVWGREQEGRDWKWLKMMDGVEQGGKRGNGRGGNRTLRLHRSAMCPSLRLTRAIFPLLAKRFARDL